MGVGVSLPRLAGSVAACGAMGTISSVNAGYKEDDFLDNPVEANLRALEKEIAKAKELSEGKGMIAVNIMTSVTNYEATCKCAVAAGADAIISGAGLLMKHYKKNYDVYPDFFVIEGSRALIEAVKGNWEEGLFFTGSNADRVDKIMSVRELIREIMDEFILFATPRTK